MSRTSPEDTIAAVATPPGEGGIGIVRVSGAQAIPIVHGVFASSTGKDLRSDTRQVYHGVVRDGEAIFDEVLVHVMRAPHSFTCEDVVEINCHGGAGPVNAVLELIIRKGARLANPGEFTRRAFFNGRIDLVQAEAVIDLVRAQTHAGMQSAAAASRGVLSQAIYAIRDELVTAKAHVEAAIDFADQDVPDQITPELLSAVTAARERATALLATADAGVLLHEGASIAITGRPNVGKSSLFNTLLRDNRAIVTEQPGTTRDLLHETIQVAGIPIRLTDTAGLRTTDNEVERIGVAKSRDAIAEAAVVLYMVDASEALGAEDEELVKELAALATPLVLVLNKTDLGERIDAAAFNGQFAKIQKTSVIRGEGLEELESALSDLLQGGAQVAPDQARITRIHQKDSLRRALEAIERVETQFDQSPEFLGIELDDALRALGEITGETTPDDVLEQVFASFCIGK